MILCAVVSEQELWKFAAALLRKHGEGVYVHVAVRTAELALEGDLDGVAFWKRIAAKVSELAPGDKTRQ